MLLLLFLHLKRNCGRKWEQFSQKEEDRDNIFCYNEEGYGEQDQVHMVFLISCSLNPLYWILLYSVFMLCMCVLQVYDMMLLCRRPEIFPTNIAPTALHTALYWQHPEEKEDVGNFIYEVCIVKVFLFVCVWESPSFLQVQHTCWPWNNEKE